MMYHHFDGVSYIRRAANYYKISKFNLLGRMIVKVNWRVVVKEKVCRLQFLNLKSSL